MNGTEKNSNRFFDPDLLVAPDERYYCNLSLLVHAVRTGYVEDDWDSVVEMMDALAQLGELDNHSRLLRAKALMEIGKYDDSLTELIFLSSNDPWCATTQQLLGEVRLYKKRYKEAARSFTSAIGIKAVTSIVPGETVSYLGRAMAFTFMGRHSAAATDMHTFNTLSQLRKARNHFWNQRHAQCELYLETLPDKIHSLPAAQYLKVRNIMATRDYERALLAFPKVLSVSHVGLPFLYCRAVCNYKTNNLQACIADLTRIIGLATRVVLLELNPVVGEVDLVDITQVYSLRASCNKQLKNYSAAIEDYEKVLYFNPTSETYLARAQVLYGLGLIARALTDVTKAEETLADDLALQSLKMLCLARLERRQESAEIAQAILKREPDNSMAKLTLEILATEELFVAPPISSHWIAN